MKPAQRGQAAAFFDVDGTLLPLPSLERLFFRWLRGNGRLPVSNYLAWLGEALRLAPRGLTSIVHSNKMYLRGTDASWGGEFFEDEFFQVRSNAATRQLCFFPAALARLAWHAREGHAIVLVTGTLEPLACCVARSLEDFLRAQDCAACVDVCATRLAVAGVRWTGGLAGEAVYGGAKARVIREYANRYGICLTRSWAYGDSASDRWMLESVAHPVTVNASPALRRFAQRRSWPTLRWQRTSKKPDRASSVWQRNPEGAV